MNQEERFECFVLFLAEKCDISEYNIKTIIYKLEERIKALGGKAYFGAARSDWDGIQIVKPYATSKWKFHAEYYDGCQAEFIVCEWYEDFEKLEQLLKEIDITLYEEYLKYLLKDN